MKEKTTVDEMQQVIGIEQFLNSFPQEKRLWLVEKKPRSCVAAGELVDEFEQTRRRVAEGNVPQLLKLLGSEEPEMANIDDMLVVMTRDKAQQQLEERIQQMEKEIALGSKPHDLVLAEVKATVDGTGPKKGAGDPSCGFGHPVSVEELKTLQKKERNFS
eukprot:Em0003g275a